MLVIKAHARANRTLNSPSSTPTVMDSCRGSTPGLSSLSVSDDRDQKRPVVFRRMSSSDMQFSSSRASSQKAPTNGHNGTTTLVSGPPSVNEDDRRYNASTSPSSYDEGKIIISLVDEALARATTLADAAIVASWMASHMVEEAYDGEMVMKVEIYLSQVCLREFRKTRSESRFLQAASLIGNLFKLGAISSMHLLSIAETLVFNIDLPMRIQGVVVLFESAGSRLCHTDKVARTIGVAAKLKEASSTRPENRLLKRCSKKIKHLVEGWIKMEEYKALWE